MITALIVYGVLGLLTVAYSAQDHERSAVAFPLKKAVYLLLCWWLAWIISAAGIVGRARRRRMIRRIRGRRR